MQKEEAIKLAREIYQNNKDVEIDDNADICETSPGLDIHAWIPVKGIADMMQLCWIPIRKH